MEGKKIKGQGRPPKSTEKTREDICGILIENINVLN